MIGFNYLGKMGQLGNQMFQYAAALGIATLRNASLCTGGAHQLGDVFEGPFAEACPSSSELVLSIMTISITIY